MLLPLAREEGHDGVGKGQAMALPISITDTNKADFCGLELGG